MTGLLVDEHISSFLLRIRQRTGDEAAGLILDTTPPDTGTGVTADLAPPAVDMDTGISASAVADGTAPARKCKKRYSGGPQAKLRAKQHCNERRSTGGGGADGDV